MADLPELVGFFSYSREDDEDSYGALSALRDRIQHELRGQLGRSMKSFRLWQDKEAIAAGRVWESEIKGAVSQAVFFIPIITPTVVQSPYCRFELDSFLAREAALGRDDLVFPILYIRVPALEDGPQLKNDPVLSVIARRQYVDWRDFRHRDVNSMEVKEAIQRFCANICDALYRPWVSPEERKAQEEAAALQRAEAERNRQQAEAEAKRQQAEAEAKHREEELREEAARARERAEEERRKREADAERQRAEAEEKKAEAERQKAELERQRAEAQPVPKVAETPVRGEEEQRPRPQPPELPQVRQPQEPPPALPTAGQPPELPPARRLPELPPARSRTLLLAVSLIGIVILGAVGAWLLRPAPVEPIKPGVPLSAAQERTLKPKDTFQECTNCPVMVVVPAGSFGMGSPESETGHNANEGPQHTVTIAQPFAVGEFMISFDEWDACVADAGCNAYKPDDSGWGRGRQPVINVSSADANAYVAWLSKKTGKTYRLLSEAEYEYVARAGTETPFWWGSTISTSQANYDGDSTYANGAKGGFRERTMPVDSFSPNPWGLYQVDGNVYELTDDCYNKTYSGAPANGSAWTPANCGDRIVRGGAYASDASNLRSASRGEVMANLRGSGLGFRVARALAH